jgi:hypothetical protein
MTTADLATHNADTVAFLDRLTDLGECEYLNDDVRDDIRMAVALLAAHLVGDP